MYDVYIINDSERERKQLRDLFVCYQISNNVEMEICGYSYLTFNQIPEAVTLFVLDAVDRQTKDMIKRIRSANMNHVIIFEYERMTQILDVMTPITLPSAFLAKPVDYNSLEEQLALLEYATSTRTNNDKEVFTWTCKARTISIPISSILFFESRNKKTFLVTEAKEYELSKTLDAIEQELHDGFIRTHRSYLVNQKHIREYDFGNMLLRLDDNSQVLISRNGKGNIKRVMG